MPLLLRGIDERGIDATRLDGVEFLAIANAFRVPGYRVDCSPVSFIDCGPLDGRYRSGCGVRGDHRLVRRHAHYAFVRRVSDQVFGIGG